MKCTPLDKAELLIKQTLTAFTFKLIGGQMQVHPASTDGQVAHGALIALIDLRSGFKTERTMAGFELGFAVDLDALGRDRDGIDLQLGQAEQFFVYLVLHHLHVRFSPSKALLH